MDESATPAADLPESVRTRLVALVAASLPEVARLPPALKRVADFAPARRARLGATAILAALDAEDDFRERSATQVGDRLPADAEAPVADDPAEAAARAWLLRPEGWVEVLAAARARLAEREDAAVRETGQLERLRARLEKADQDLRDQRGRYREQVDALKADNAALRRKLGETRAARAAAESEDDAARTEAVEALAQAQARAAGQDKELRRLRAQVAQLVAEAGAEKRSARSEREEATLRARLLLETVIESASGLRRELGLPTAAGAPADRVEEALTALSDEGTRQPSSAGALGVGSPALLEQYLTMPRARLIIDGYNVSKSAWPSSPLEAQRIRLLQALAPLVARTNVETTVVFDAAATSVRPVVATPRGVKVLFSPEGVIADDVIRDLVAAEPPGRVVVVVTNDREIVEDVLRAECRVSSAEALVRLLGS